MARAGRARDDARVVPPIRSLRVSRTSTWPRSVLVAVAVALPLSVALPAGAASPAPGVPAEDTPVASEQLFALGAAGGTLEADASGTIRLTLDGPGPRLIQYADRPGRTAEWLSLDSFVAAWPALFAGDPPNAALSWAPAMPDHVPGMLVVELGEPILAADPATLGFPVIVAPVGGEDLLATDWPDRSTPLRLDSPSLAIDGAASSVYTMGSLTVVAMPGDQAVAVSATLHGVSIGSATLTLDQAMAQLSGSVAGDTADVTLDAEIPFAMQTGLLFGEIQLVEGGDTQTFNGVIATWNGSSPP